MSNFVNMFITREDGFWNVNPIYFSMILIKQPFYIFGFRLSRMALDYFYFYTNCVVIMILTIFVKSSIIGV